MEDKTADELFELCDQVVQDYQARDALFDSLEAYYFLDEDRDDETKAEAEVEVVREPHGTQAIDLVMDLLAGADLQITVPAADEKTTAKKVADAGELYLWAAKEQSERAQRLDILGRCGWTAGMRGCLAGRVMPVDEWLKEGEGDDGKQEWSIATKLPLVIQLRDPRYIYPSFGIDGLAFVVERSTRTVQEVRNSYGPDMLAGRKATEEVDWTEYWDAEQFCYWMDGNRVAKDIEGQNAEGPWLHKWGGNPYSFEFARATMKPEPEKQVRPLLEGVKNTIRRLDLLSSQQATFISRYIGDTLNVFSNEMATEGSDRDISVASGETNYLMEDERMEWLRAGHQPVELPTMMARLEAAIQKGTFPDTLYGQDPGRVMAGYAINLLNQSGQLRLQPIVDCIERFLEDIFSTVLMISEVHIQPMTGAPIDFYTMSEEDKEGSKRSKFRQGHTLDASKLDGFWEVGVSLGNLLPADEQSNIVLAGRAREPGPDGRPLLSDETIYERFSIVSSASQEQDRIDRQLAMIDPQVMALKRRLIVEEVLQEIGDELRKMDIDPDQVLAEEQARQNPQPEPQQPQMTPEMMAMMEQQQAMMAQQQAMQQGAPGMLPPGVMPPQMQGQMMPQPGMPGEEGMPPMMPPEMMMPGMG